MGPLLYGLCTHVDCNSVWQAGLRREGRVTSHMRTYCDETVSQIRFIMGFMIYIYILIFLKTRWLKH